jgi:hypothetical protein
VHVPLFSTPGHGSVVLPEIGGKPMTVGSSCLPTTTPIAKSLGRPDLLGEC